MKYRCRFLNPDTDERKTIVAALSAAEVDSIEAMRAAKDENADVMSEALALRHAYAEVPGGFWHTDPPTLVQLN